jgi:hypothetical protein
MQTKHFAILDSAGNLERTRQAPCLMRSQTAIPPMLANLPYLPTTSTATRLGTLCWAPSVSTPDLFARTPGLDFL